MKLLSSISIIITFIAATAFITGPSSTIPSAEVNTLDGKTVNIKDYIGQGKITVVSFWATWCGPCKKELDAIAKVYPAWQEKYNVELIAITIDEARSLARVPALIEKKGWDYTVLADVNQELKEALKFQTIPQTFLLDQKGEIIYSHNSYNPGDELELEEKISALVK